MVRSLAIILQCMSFLIWNRLTVKFSVYSKSVKKFEKFKILKNMCCIITIYISFSKEEFVTCDQEIHNYMCFCNGKVIFSSKYKRMDSDHRLLQYVNCIPKLTQDLNSTTLLTAPAYSASSKASPQKSISECSLLEAAF